MHTFHIHIYFSESEIALAMLVRENIIQAIPHLTYIGKPIPQPIGPHTKPMFEIHITETHISDTIPIIEELRQGLSVLIHPVQEDELEAHTTLAKWLGEKLPLNLNALPPHK